MHKIKVLITSPSIISKENISGIANLTRLLVENNREVLYSLFSAGKKDSQKRNLSWFLKQPKSVYRFYIQAKMPGIQIIHINMPLEKGAILRDSMFVLISRIVKKKCVLHLRGGSFSKNSNTPWYLKQIVRLALNYANIVILLGENEKQFVQQFYNICVSKLYVLPNCVKIPDYKGSSLDGNEKLNILYLGRFDVNKGLNEIVNGLAQLNPSVSFTLQIAGEGPYKKAFLANCQDKLADMYVFHGIADVDLKNILLANSHVFLLPSYFEGLPNSLLEAMSYGVIPVVTDVGSMSEVVKHNENGIFVPVKNAVAIKNAIEYLYSNPNLRRQLSSQAYKTISESYSLENYMSNLNHLYYRCINNEV